MQYLRVLCVALSAALIARFWAGTVTAGGDGVGDFASGDRVAYAGGMPGAYASARNLPAERLLKLPEGVSTRLAATSLLRGLTAHMLLRRVFSAKPG